MRRIKIDDNLVQVIENFNKELFNDKNAAFVLPKKSLKKLFVTITCKKQRRYLIKLYFEYEILINLKPSEFAQKKIEFDNIYTIDGVKKSTSTEFGKEVVQALRYDAYRDSQYPKLLNSLGWNLRSCFYCNYSGTLTLKKDNGYKTYYDLDHIYPKSICPFLATSFFNFIPVCACCNRCKSNHIIKNLNPFYEINEKDINLEKVFKISQKSKAQFYTNNDIDLIDITIADKVNNVDLVDMNKIIDLKLLYNSQKHEAQEILWKKKIYTKNYIKSIMSNFKKIMLNDKDINRILWGTDLDENTINDKPLAKLKFDLINDK